MAVTFPTDATTKASPIAADLLVIADTADSNNWKKVTLKSAREYVDSKVTSPGGENILSGASVNLIGDGNRAASALQSCNIFGGGGIGDLNGTARNSIGDHSHPSHTNPYNAAHAVPSYTTIIGSYDQCNNQQATLLASPHSFAPSTNRAGHNFALAGSSHKVDGDYSGCLGGQDNETGNLSNFSVCVGGANNINHASNSVILGGDSIEMASTHNYAVTMGRDTKSIGQQSVSMGSQDISSTESVVSGHIGPWRVKSTGTGTKSFAIAGTSTYWNIWDIQHRVGESPIATIKVTIRGKCRVSGHNLTSGVIDEYLLDFMVTMTGQQGVQSGWTFLWSDGTTTQYMPESMRTDVKRVGSPQAMQIPLTQGPRINTHSSGIIRLQLGSNTTDSVIWTSDMDVVIDLV